MATGETHDVIVVGAGIWGLCCAWSCVEKGLHVAVLDAGHPGSGASGGIVGAMAPHVPERWDATKQFQLESLIAAGDFWCQVDATSGLSSGFDRTGRIMPIPNENLLELAYFRIKSALDLWGSDYSWTVQRDGHELISVDCAPLGVVHESLSSRIAPAKACASLSAALRNRGVDILEGHPVSAVSAGHVVGPWGEMRAPAIILAGGVGGFDLLDTLVPVQTGKGVKGQAALLECDLVGQPQIFADGIYIVPHADRTVAVGSTSENSFDDPASVDGKLDDILVRARLICPRLDKAPVTLRWAGLRPKARKRDPMLGAVPGNEGIFAALGAFKIGFGIAHKVGDMLADCITGKEIDLPERFCVEHHIK